MRDKIQKEAVKAILDHNGKGIIALPTGVGKSKIAIDYLKQLYKQDKRRFLWVVPTEKLRDEGVKEEFSKWDAKNIYNACLSKYCYASINKLKGLEFDAVILDEGHNITENNSKFFDQNIVHSVVVITATPPHEDDKKELLYNKLNLEIIYTLTLNQAVEMGLVAPYKIKVIESYLDDVDKYIEAGSKNKRFMTTEFKQYQYLTRVIEKIRFSGKEVPKFMYLNRMRFLYQLKSKMLLAEKVLESIPKDDRVLIFHKSIEKAEKLCYHTFHSKSDDKSFQKFVSGKINRLSVVDALNEGHNIPNLDKAVIVQVNSNPRELIQRKFVRLSAVMY